MATLLTSIVLVFLLCHSTKMMTNMYEAWQVLYLGRLMYWPVWAGLLSRFNHLMLAVNASINIFIYVIKVRPNTTGKHQAIRYCFQDFKFRTALKNMLRTSLERAAKVTSLGKLYQRYRNVRLYQKVCQCQPKKRISLDRKK